MWGKVITAVAALQLLVSLLLVVGVLDLQTRVDALADLVSLRARADARAPSASRPSTPLPSADAAPVMTPEMVRSLVRETVRETVAVDGTPAPAREPETVPADVSARRLQAAQETLDVLISQGRMSELDMARLEAQIAGLNPADQRAVLIRLTGAINTGELDARL